MRSLPYVFFLTILFTFIIISVLPEKDVSVNSEPKQYLVINYPWASLKNTVEISVKSYGLPIEQGVASFMLITASSNPNFINDAYQNGAVLVLSPIIKGGCFRRSKNKFVEV